MRQAPMTPKRSAVEGYSVHSGVVTLVLLTLAAVVGKVATAGYPTIAVGFYALALAVAAPLLASDVKAVYTWLRG